VDVAELDYDLPPTAIAQEAIEPRDAARLLVTRTMEDRRFHELDDLLAPGDVLVVNRTRVRAARLAAVKDTGGSVELLLLRRVDERRWEAMLRPARRVRVGTRLQAGPICAEVLSAPAAGVATVALDAGGTDLETAIAEFGSYPLPPYFHGHLPDPERYQTMFAEVVGSAAAPTAGLHFTPPLIDRLAARGVAIASVELEVGLDTFRPMTGEHVADHTIHRERYVMPPEAVAAIGRARLAGGRVVAVGTTVVRVLETAVDADCRPRAGGGETDLFLTPGWIFRSVDAVITNFHAPRTTLVAMVAAMLGPGWRSLYATALERGYRFLSFGDAMLIELAERS
jgi:S-adenosylmethionine:tRNA ribosyltransferase-isomerase